MENGVHELKSKVVEFDTDVNGLFLSANDGVETEPATKEVEDENGGVNDDNDDDAVEARETRIVSEKLPVEAVVSLKVIDEVSTSDSTTMDQPVVTDDNKSNENTDLEEPEVKLLNSVEVIEERNTSDSATSNKPGELEANATVNDGESTSDKGACDELNDTETDASAVGEKDEVKSESVSDEQKIHTDVSKDEANELENNGRNEDENVSNAGILEDVNEVNKKPVTLVLETSENGVSNHVDLEQTVIREDDVNGDVIERDMPVTERKDGDCYKPKEKLETSSNSSLNMQNGSTVEHIQDDKKVEEESTSTIDEPDSHVEITVSPEAEKSELKNHETKQDITSVKKESDLRPVVGVSLPTPTSVTPKHDSKPNQSPVPNSKPPRAATPAPTESRPVIGVSLPTPKSATPKHDSEPNQSPVPNSKPPRAATLAPTESKPVIGVSLPTPKSATPKHDSKPNQSQVPNSKPPPASTPAPTDSRPVIGVSLPTPKTATPKHDSKPNQYQVPNSKLPPVSTPAMTDSRPVIGVSLPTPKSATPKHDPTPNQSTVPNSKPPLAATPTPPAPSASTRPTGLGSAAPLPEPAHRVVRSQPNGNTSPPNQVIEEPTNGEADENDETREKLQMIRVKFLRLARRLGQTTHNVAVAQVLYRLGLAEQLRGSNGGRVGAFSFERASAMAEQLEAAGQDPLEFSCIIMVLGKTGVGKSATINSIFDEVKFGTDPFKHGTTKVQDVVGTVQGIKVRVIDTPGLHSSWADQRKNEKILHSVKRFIQKSPPDIVLYLDRLDMQSRDSGDMHLLKSITDVFGQSIWFNAIVVLTHAASAPPDGPNGAPTAYDMFVTQRSHVVQQAIRQAAGDMRLMNPVSLVENHSACRTNPAGQRVLPNAQVWKPHLLLLSFASKILVEANMLLKLQDSPPGKPFAARTRQPPLPYILSNLLQSRPQLKLPQDQFGDDDDDDVGDDASDDSDDDAPSEYDELPPFKRLTRSQLSKLSKAQKKAYYDELEYREKLFMKKQLKDEMKRRKLMKKMAAINVDSNDDVEDESSGAATVPVAVQDMTLPVSFDADNPTHRYRALDSANQWLTRPVLDPHGWDHDVGYEGINVEHLLALRDKIPISFTGQITKDKKDANLQLEVSSALKHGKSKSNSTTVAFDMQTVGKEMSYTLRSDTRFINYRKNKASVGLSGTYFGDALTGGVKFEDKLTISKRGQIVVAGGAVIGRGDVAYGGSLEATLRDKVYPLGRFLSTIGLSVMDWHGDLALGWNAQSQIPIGRSINLIGRVNLNNKGSGQVSVRLNSSEQLQLALAALVPVFCKLLGYYQDQYSAY
ncbi:translocase of chloroplast 120, chloroplastic-like [Bidens hawaiensis]|uniref:translocase of chloroplast 120, chloroplastic-like n=1 Tax=Bidens hawaiensis TaxID=980011 RepID=UPI00404A85EF